MYYHQNYNSDCLAVLSLTSVGFTDVAGYGPSVSQIMLLRADDVKQIMMQELARKQTWVDTVELQYCALITSHSCFSLSVSHTVIVPTVCENVTWRLRFLPEQLLLHLAIPNQPVPSALPMNATNEVKVKPSSDSLHKQYRLLETLKACCDSSGRQVAALFIELPSRHVSWMLVWIVAVLVDVSVVLGISWLLPGDQKASWYQQDRE